MSIGEEIASSTSTSERPLSLGQGASRHRETNGEMRTAEKIGAVLVIAAVALVIAVGARATASARRGADANGRAAGRPHRDADVVARVPGRAVDPATAERAALTRQLVLDPSNLDQALRLARLDVTATRESADPRFLGRAERTLSPWWDLDRPPADVLLLRATIRQSRHEFDAALVDLDRLVEERPDDPQAWLTRAVVLGVRGRYEEALQSCEHLVGLVPRLDVIACQAPLYGLTGHAGEMRATLSAAIPDAPNAVERAWALSVLAELSLWAGDVVAAEAQFRAALATTPGDRYSRGALADLLLDQRRYDEVRELVAERTQDDGLLLRQALAEAAQRQPPPSTSALARTSAAGVIPPAEPSATTSGSPRPSSMSSGEGIRELALRMEASRRRGDTVHLREESRAALAIDGDGPRALALATRNWEVQHEPADARVFLEAAVATGDRRAAAPILAWLAQTGFEWPTLRQLVVTLGSES